MYIKISRRNKTSPEPSLRSGFLKIFPRITSCLIPCLIIPILRSITYSSEFFLVCSIRISKISVPQQARASIKNKSQQWKIWNKRKPSCFTDKNRLATFNFTLEISRNN